MTGDAGIQQAGELKRYSLGILGLGRLCELFGPEVKRFV